MAIKVRILLFASLFAMFLVLGCESSSTPSRVYGRIKYRGMLVTGGTIAFRPTTEGEGGYYKCAIKPDGTYEGTDFPAGEFVVTIENESTNPHPAAVANGRFVPIPNRYADEKTSGLRRILTKGSNNFDFDLTD